MRLSKLALVSCVLLAGCGSGRVASRHDTTSPRVAPSAPAAKSTPVASAKARPSQDEPFAALGISPAEYPPLGSCRVWVSGKPVGPPCSCFSLMLNVPAGATVLYRPSSDESVLQVTKYDAAQPNTILSMDLYDAKSGKYLRSAKR